MTDDEYIKTIPSLSAKELIDELNYCGRDPYYDKIREPIVAEITNRLEKIADLKANFDLAIEGRDIKIKELEQELTVQKDLIQEETNLHLHAEDYIKSLEQQIEKMKCCENCIHHSFWGNELKCNLMSYDDEFECLKTKSKWELDVK